jgi:hypothetical protein
MVVIGGFCGHGGGFAVDRSGYFAADFQNKGDRVAVSGSRLKTGYCLRNPYNHFFAHGVQGLINLDQFCLVARVKESAADSL